jgi:membrane protease YdiL (CAAX protease family)
MKFSRMKLLMIAFFAEGAAFLAALALAWYFDIDSMLFTDNIQRDLIIGTAGAFPPLALFIFTLSGRAENIPVLGSLRKTMITELKEVFSDLRFFDIVLISMLAGFAEEVLFRGVVQARFGIVTASVLFGLVHCVTPSYIFVAVLMGFYLGGFFSLFDSLLVPVQLHFFYDLGALLYLKYFIPQSTKPR